MNKPKITPDILTAIEGALEERKKGPDRRKELDPAHPHADPVKDRRSGQDRRN